MPLIPFGAYAPDQGDLNQSVTSLVQNVTPQGDGYGPFPSLSSLTASLPAACRGCFFARNTNGSALLFAGTLTDLYLLDNTTFSWTKVSLGGGPYSSLAINDNWQFEQFGNIVLATQKNVVLQEYDVTSSTAFANTAGSPPQAAYIAIVNGFVVLAGLLTLPFRVQWSGLNDRTNWVAGVNSSDFQDLPNGGVARGITGGELGFIIQDQAIRRMVFIPGSDVIFQIDRIHRDIGVIAPYSVVVAQNEIFFLSAKGFMQMDGNSGALEPIGNEKVDRTFFAEWDRSYPQLMIGCGAPDSNFVCWGYKTTSSADSTSFNKILGFNYVLKRWFPVSQSGQYLSSLAVPATTLEALDALVPGSVNITGAANNGSGLIRLTVTSTSGWTTGDVKTVQGVTGTTEANTQPLGAGPGSWKITVIDGTHIDLQASTFTHTYISGGIVGGSLDAYLTSLDNISAVSVPKLAAISTTGALGFFTGANLEATVQTSEQGDMIKRLWIKGWYPDTDAPTLYGSTARRENLNATPSYVTEQAMNAQGYVPQRADTRYARAKIRIPASAVWTYARGVNPEDPKQTGRR